MLVGDRNSVDVVGRRVVVIVRWDECNLLAHTRRSTAVSLPRYLTVSTNAGRGSRRQHMFDFEMHAFRVIPFQGRSLHVPFTRSVNRGPRL